MDVFSMQHAYHDGRLEEVVLRHLGAEDGHTVIAKNIRFSLFLFFCFQLSISLLLYFFPNRFVHSLSFGYCQAVRFPC